MISTITTIPAKTLAALQRWHWPGNIRELRNVIERATIRAEGDFIEAKHLPPVLVVAFGWQFVPQVFSAAMLVDSQPAKVATARPPKTTTRLISATTVLRAASRRSARRRAAQRSDG